MPKPVYIICAEKTSIDQETNLVSFFNVIDSLNIDFWGPDSAPPQPRQIGIMGAKVVASWAKVSSDEGKEFEGEMLIETPTGDEVSTGLLEFKFEKGKLFHRFVMTIAGIPPTLES